MGILLGISAGKGFAASLLQPIDTFFLSLAVASF